MSEKSLHVTVTFIKSRLLNHYIYTLNSFIPTYCNYSHSSHFEATVYRFVYKILHFCSYTSMSSEQKRYEGSTFKVSVHFGDPNEFGQQSWGHLSGLSYTARKDETLIELINLICRFTKVSSSDVLLWAPPLYDDDAWVLDPNKTFEENGIMNGIIPIDGNGIIPPCDIKVERIGTENTPSGPPTKDPLIFMQRLLPGKTYDEEYSIELIEAAQRRFFQKRVDRVWQNIYKHFEDHPLTDKPVASPVW